MKQLSLEDAALVLTTLGSSRDNPGSTPLDPVEIPGDDGKYFNIVYANWSIPNNQVGKKFLLKRIKGKTGLVKL